MELVLQRLLLLLCRLLRCRQLLRYLPLRRRLPRRLRRLLLRRCLPLRSLLLGCLPLLHLSQVVLLLHRQHLLHMRRRSATSGSTVAATDRCLAPPPSRPGSIICIASAIQCATIGIGVRRRLYALMMCMRKIMLAMATTLVMLIAKR